LQVCGYDRQGLSNRLRDQNAVEWVAVVERKVFQSQNVPRAQRQNGY
jgi:hypothetical protein